jgi:GNAT superfamily N-acetyltransferase
VKANYNIRKPEPSDVQAVANFRTVLEHGDYYRRYLTPDFYQWKYFQNPIHPSCVRVAEDRGRLIALAAATFKKLKIGETTFLCGELGDFLVHPEYRHQGIFTALAEEICAKSLADGARVIYVRPNDSSFPGLLRLGFKEVFRPKPMMKILNAQNVLRRRVANRVLFHLTRPIAAGLVRLAYRRSAGRIPPDLEISRVSCFDDSIDELWERAAKQYRTIVVRDKVYLNWRYAKNPCMGILWISSPARTVLNS